jgi:hypothetical protein
VPHIEGKTNLPDGTDFEVTVIKDSFGDLAIAHEMTVHSGHFGGVIEPNVPPTDLAGPDDPARIAPGRYHVEITGERHHASIL